MRIQELIDNKMKVELNQQNAATAMNITDSLIREYGHLPDARAQINEQISQIENEDLRQKTFREVDWQLAARNRAQAEERGAIFESAERYLMGGGSVDQFIADNPDEWELLLPDQQKQLLTGPVITTNFDTLAALTLLPPHELAKIEPSDYFSQLNDQDRRTLIKSVADAREGKNTGQVGRTQTAEVSSVINRIYGPPNSSARKKADANGQVDSFYAMVTAEHQHRIDLNGGKDLNSAQFTEMLNDLAGKITTNRTVFGINTPWTSEQTISTMPPESLAEISAGLRQDGIPVTAESLVSVYNERDEVWGIPMENLPELSRVLRQYNIPVTPETLTEAYRQATQ